MARSCGMPSELRRYMGPCAAILHEARLWHNASKSQYYSRNRARRAFHQSHCRRCCRQLTVLVSSDPASTAKVAETTAKLAEQTSGRCLPLFSTEHATLYACLVFPTRSMPCPREFSAQCAERSRHSTPLTQYSLVPSYGALSTRQPRIPRHQTL